MGVKKVVTLATEEFVINLANTIRAEIEGKKFDQLKTDDKTILGSINEVNDLLQIFTVPEYDVNAPMYYGILDPQDIGNIHSYNDITIDMFDNDKFIKTKPGKRSIPIGHVKQGQLIVVAIPVIFDLIAVKDDGFGNHIKFDESVLGVNGVDVRLGDQPYLLFGEFVLVEGDRKIAVITREPIEPICKCPEVTDADIENIINGIE
jgi:hypothetical protein